MFYRMGQVYSTKILDLSKFQMTRLKVISLIVSTIFILGSAHFFLFNALIFIIEAYDRDYVPSSSFKVIQRILEYFELATPLVCGFFLIYIVWKVGFIDEEDDELLSSLSQTEYQVLFTSSFLKNNLVVSEEQKSQNTTPMGSIVDPSAAQSSSDLKR